MKYIPYEIWKVRIILKHRFRLIIFQMILEILNNISHAGILRHCAHAPTSPSFSEPLFPSLITSTVFISYYIRCLLVRIKGRSVPVVSLSCLSLLSYFSLSLPLLSSYPPYCLSVSPKDVKVFFFLMTAERIQRFNSKLRLSLKGSGIIWERKKMTEERGQKH